MGLAWGRSSGSAAQWRSTPSSATVLAGSPPTEIDPRRLWRLTRGLRGAPTLTQRRPSDGRPRSPVTLGEASQNERVGNILSRMFANRRAVLRLDLAHEARGTP